MKRTYIILVFILFLVLCGCEPNAYYFKNNSRNDQIISIEFISYTTEEISIIKDPLKLNNLILDKIETVDILENELKVEFIDEFSKLEFFKDYPLPDSPSGKGIKMTYDNGDFLLVIETVVEDVSYCDAILYNSNGEFLTYYGSLSWITSFDTLVKQYFLNS